MRSVAFERRETVRIGMIGVGGRGMSLLGDLLRIDGAQITAVSDILPERAEQARARVVAAGQAPPVLYPGEERGCELLCAREDVDLVYVATPWDLHAPMAVRAMELGKHAAVEVPAATTIEDCWRLVDASEHTRRHCVMLENCCYGYNEMLVNRIVHAGLLGDITHGEAAYIHDLRPDLLADRGEGLWRRSPHATRDGNLYPTHGLGPVARYMDIHRGDRFAFLVSVSSMSRSLATFRDAHLAADDAKRCEHYTCGDMNTSILKTVGGRTILLQHDVVTPRPYDRNNLISGTRGTFRDYPPRLYLDGQPEADAWMALDAFKDEYEDPLWTRWGELARSVGGHDGMDYLMNVRLIQCMREGRVPDIDVYDAAAWSAPGPLSEQSVAQGSAPVAFPDFTRGT